MNQPAANNLPSAQRFQKVYSFVINMMDKGLPSYLTYHNAEHTGQVLEAVEKLSALENLSDFDRFILSTAALFHDTGFLKGNENHEEESCIIAGEILPSYAYTEAEIDEVCRIIMATKPGSSPADKLQQLMCDADLYYLGTDSFIERSAHLYDEMKYLGKVKNEKDWQQVQISFLTSHKYYSNAARQQLNKIKQQNVGKVMNDNKKSIPIKNPSRYSTINDYFLIAFGVLSAGFALKGFLVPNKFFDGGITGISLLLHELYHWNLAFVIVIANLAFIVTSYFTVSKNFAIKTLVSVILLGLCLLYVPYPIITSDKLLISIFGGFFIGVGIGLTMRAGSALDGVEVLALYTLKRTSFTITEIILSINVLIFCFAATKFGIETALYSVLTYFTASRTIDYVVEGIEAYTGVTIISGQSEVIKHRLVNELGRGITVYKGERGFLPGQYEISEDCDIIFTVVTRLELRRLKNLVYQSDPKAFVFANTIKEASGGIVKKLHKH